MLICCVHSVYFSQLDHLCPPCVLCTVCVGLLCTVICNLPSCTVYIDLFLWPCVLCPAGLFVSLCLVRRCVLCLVNTAVIKARWSVHRIMGYIDVSRLVPFFIPRGTVHHNASNCLLNPSTHNGLLYVIGRLIVITIYRTVMLFVTNEDTLP